MRSEEEAGIAADWVGPLILSSHPLIRRPAAAAAAFSRAAPVVRPLRSADWHTSAKCSSGPRIRPLCLLRRNGRRGRGWKSCCCDTSVRHTVSTMLADCAYSATHSLPAPAAVSLSSLPPESVSLRNATLRGRRSSMIKKVSCPVAPVSGVLAVDMGCDKSPGACPPSHRFSSISTTTTASSTGSDRSAVSAAARCRIG